MFLLAEQGPTTRTTTPARGRAPTSRSTPATTTTPRSTRSCRPARRAGSNGTTGSAWITVRDPVLLPAPEISVRHRFARVLVVMRICCLHKRDGNSAALLKAWSSMRCMSKQLRLKCLTVCHAGLLQGMTSGAGTCASPTTGWAGRIRPRTRPPAQAAASQHTPVALRPRRPQDSGRRPRKPGLHRPCLV